MHHHPRQGEPADRSDDAPEVHPDQQEQHPGGSAHGGDDEEMARVARRQRGAVVGNADRRRHHRQRDQHQHRTGVHIAVVVEEIDQHGADQRQRPHQGDQTAGHQVAHVAQLAGAGTRALLAHLAVDRDHHPADQFAAEQQREAAEIVADVVDPQHMQGEELAEHQLVALAGKEPEQRRDEDPLAEMDEFVGRGRVPAEAVAMPVEEPPRQQQHRHRLHDIAEHQRDDVLRVPGDRDHEHQRNRLGAELHQRNLTELEVPDRGLDPSRDEPGDDHREDRDRQEIGKLRRVEEQRGRVGEQAGEDPQDEAADHLERVGGIEKFRIVAAFRLGDRRGDAHVGEQRQAHFDHRHQCHQAEGFREQQARQDEVRQEPQELARAIAHEHDRRAAQHAGHQAVARNHLGRTETPNRQLQLIPPLGHANDQYVRFNFCDLSTDRSMKSRQNGLCMFLQLSERFGFSLYPASLPTFAHLQRQCGE